MRWCSLIAGVAAAALLSGCSDGPKTAHVSGRVTLDGNPLANAEVMFSPIAPKDNPNPGPTSGAVTDAEGRYTLILADGKETKGAVVGKHKVMIVPDRSAKRPGHTQGNDPLARYSGRNTPLEFDVPSGGTDKADFPLTSR